MPESRYAEESLRAYDSNQDGKLDVDELKSYEAARLREKKTAKTIVIIAISVAILAVAANIGMSYAVAIISKDTSVDHSVLVDKRSGDAVVTKNRPTRMAKRKGSDSRRLSKRRSLLQTEDMEDTVTAEAVAHITCEEAVDVVSDLTLGIYDANGLLEIDAVNKTMYVLANTFVITGSNMYVQFRFPSSSDSSIDPNDDYTCFLGSEGQTCTDDDESFGVYQGQYSSLVTSSRRRALLADEGLAPHLQGPMRLEVWHGLPLEDGITARRHLSSLELPTEYKHAPAEESIGHPHLSLTCEAAKGIFQAVLSGEDDVKAEVDLADLDAQHLLQVRLAKLRLSDNSKGAQQISGIAAYRTWELDVGREPFSLHCPEGFSDDVEAGRDPEPGCACFLSLDNAKRKASLAAATLRRQLLSSSADSPGSASHVSGHSSSCFPPDSLVTVEPKLGSMQPLQKQINEVVLGDRILSVDPLTGATSFQDVCLKLHHDEYTDSVYNRLETENGTTLRLSPTHFVYATKGDASLNDLRSFRADARPIPARAVGPGDTIWVVRPGHAFAAPEAVAKVSVEVVKGMYNIHTMSGNLVVDGVVASQYLENSMFPDAPNGKQPLQHHLFAPLRWIWRACPSCIKMGHGPEYTRIAERSLGVVGLSVDDVFSCANTLSKLVTLSN